MDVFKINVYKAKYFPNTKVKNLNFRYYVFRR